MLSEFAFELAASNIRFGSGATREVGADIADLRLKSALVFTDPNLRDSPPVSAALESLEANGIAFRLYGRVRVEPSDQSLAEASRFAALVPFRPFEEPGGAFGLPFGRLYKGPGPLLGTRVVGGITSRDRK